MNQFLAKVNSANTLTDNGAVSNSSTGSSLADQFSKAGAQRGRPIAEVFADQSKLHAEYGIWAFRFLLYIRLITRKIKYGEDKITDTVQKGQGQRDESLKRLLWYAAYHRDIFYRNLWLLPLVGSEKDIYDLLFLAAENKIEIRSKDLLGHYVDLGGEFSDDLFKKYLPLRKANSKLTTARAKHRNLIAIWLEGIFDLPARELRKYKTSGTAHQWQQLISKKLFGEINFNRISGKALTNMVSGKFLKKQGLEDKYTAWITKQPVAKFTGYVYELYNKVTHNLKPHVKMTYDKQFDGLVKLGRDGALANRKVITAIDTSSSMESYVQGSDKTTCMSVAISLGVYFSSLLEGPFKDWVIRFSSRSIWAKLSGGFVDKCLQVKAFGDYPSNTDFQSVIDSIVATRMRFSAIPESDFPDTLLVVSDMQFDNSGAQTNYQMAKMKFQGHFSKEYCDRFMFIWWQVNGYKRDVPQTIDEPGGYVVSGFDGSIVSTILGGSEMKKPDGTSLNMEEMVILALDQEILKMVE